MARYRAAARRLRNSVLGERRCRCIHIRYNDRLTSLLRPLYSQVKFSWFSLSSGTLPGLHRLYENLRKIWQLPVSRSEPQFTKHAVRRLSTDYIPQACYDMYLRRNFGCIFAEYNQQDATFHNLFISVRHCTCFRRFSHPSSGVQNCTYSRPLPLPAAGSR